MTYKDKLFSRLDKLVEEVQGSGEVAAVVGAEEYVPPHKMAGFVPYDVIVTFDAPPAEVSEEDVEAVFDAHGVPYDRVLSIEESDDSRFDGETFAFVSLAEY